MAIINLPHVRAIQRKNTEALKIARNIVARDIPKTENGTPVVESPPVSVKVLIAFFVILGVLILGESSV